MKYGQPAGEGTVAYSPDRPPPSLGQPAQALGQPPQQQPQPQGQSHKGQPPPDDPYRPFVTAGQISGPKTPPPERQQELWNTVFGDNYQAMGDEDDIGSRGRPIWLFALVGSVVVALVGVLAWAFIAGPLASGGGDSSGNPPVAKPTTSSSGSGKSPSTTKPQSIGKRLPTYSGQASPVNGRVVDQAAALSLARLGGTWRLDSRTQQIRTAYGFTTRQFVPAGTDSTGKAQFAQVMSGPLSQKLAAKYTSPDKLAPVISTVAFQARLKFFPAGNKIVKTAQQRLSIGGRTGLLNAYQVTAGETKTTMVVAALDTGGKLPAIVYMSVPDSKKNLRPDINTVFKSVKPLA
jgi:hypothetical protein